MKTKLNVLGAAGRAVVALQHGIVGLVALAVGLSWVLRSGWPLLLLGAGLVVLLFVMNARSYVQHERARAQAEIDNAEHIEVVKLEFEHAVRAAKLGSGDPFAIMQASAHAQAHGVPAEVLQDIANRVQTEQSA